jgi:hypothetical protein
LACPTSFGTPERPSKSLVARARVKKKVLSPGEVFGEVAKMFNVRKTPCKAAKNLERAFQDGELNPFNALENKGFA